MGAVYIVTNSAVRGRVKIGMTTRVDAEVRAREFGVKMPGRTRVIEQHKTDEPSRVEREVHKALVHCSDGGEWFRCTAEEAGAAVRKAIADLTKPHGARGMEDVLRSQAEADARLREARRQAAIDAARCLLDRIIFDALHPPANGAGVAALQARVAELPRTPECVSAILSRMELLSSQARRDARKAVALGWLRGLLGEIQRDVASQG